MGGRGRLLSGAGGSGSCIRGCALVKLVESARQRKGKAGGQRAQIDRKAASKTKDIQEEEDRKGPCCRSARRARLGWSDGASKEGTDRTDRTGSGSRPVGVQRACLLVDFERFGGRGEEGREGVRRAEIMRLLTGSESCREGRSRLFFSSSSSFPSCSPSSATAPVASGGSSGSEVAKAVLLQSTPY